jgi:tetratricopeptide (TPR) repeat protein
MSAAHSTELRARATAKLERGNYAESAQLYSELWRMARNQFSDDDFRQFAICLIELQQWQDALRTLEAWSILNVQSPILFSMKGYVHTKTGELEAAEQAYRQSVQLKPRASGYCLLGDILARLGKSKEAVECFESAIEKDPTYGEGYYNLAIALRGTDPQRANNLFQTAQSLGFEPS